MVEKEFLILLKVKYFWEKVKGTGFPDLAARDKVSDYSKPRILIPKQMLQRLLVAVAQVKAGNNPENLLNEIRQTVYSLYQSKDITKKVHNNILSQYKHKMDSIFINSGIISPIASAVFWIAFSETVLLHLS